MRPHKPELPPPELLATVLEIVAGSLWWRPRLRGTAFLTARPAGSIRPDGTRIVSFKHAGRMRTMGAMRAMFALTHGVWPQGRVVEDGDRLLDLPRRARSPGRKGGKAAERARDVHALAVIAAAGAVAVSALASATGGERPNARKRLCKLAARGLVLMPQCVPSRAHYWALTQAGVEAVAEVDLLTPVHINGNRVPWIRPEAISAARYHHQVEHADDETPRLQGARRDLIARRLPHRVHAGSFIGT